MNELQIRLTADIKDLQSALAKAKQTLKSFETETATDSEKSNVGFRRKIGLIEELNIKAKQLRVSITQGTDEKQVAKLNAELEQTTIELARLNALGKNFTAPAVKSFNNLKSSVGAANGSAVAFNRIIQDAPFGLLGVGNNIQQFTEQISFLKQSTGSTGVALKSFFSSLITPTNLLILGVSALTAGLTAYQMGAFDSAEETKDLTTETERFDAALNNVIKSLNKVDSARLKANKSAAEELSELQLLNSVLNNNSKSEQEKVIVYNKLLEKYPKIIGNITQEKALTEGLGQAYNLLIASIKERASLEAISGVFTDVEKERIELIVKERKETLLQNKLIERKAELIKNISFLSKENNNATARGTTITTGYSEAISRNQQELALVNEELENLGNVIATKTEKALQENSGTLKILEEQYGGLNQSLADLSTAQDKAGESSKELNRVFDENTLFVQRFGLEADLARKKLEDLLKFEAPEKRIETEIAPVDPSALEAPLIQDEGLIEGLERQIASFEKLKEVTSDPTALARYSFEITNLKNQLASLNGEGVKSNLQLIADAFGSMGQQIANSLGISNRSLRGFVTTLVAATPKIIAAIQAKSQATGSAAIKENIANAKLAAGNSVVVATEGAKALGPVGLALLPVFIAGALALVSSAFGKAGGGGGSPSAGTGSTFTNRREFGGPVSKGRAYIVGEKRPELFVPNTNGIIVPQVPSMDYSGASMSAGAMAVEVRLKGPDDLLFFVEQAQIRRGIR